MSMHTSLFRVRVVVAVAMLAVVRPPAVAQHIEFTPCFVECHDMAMEALAAGHARSVVDWAFDRCIEEKC